MPATSLDLSFAVLAKERGKPFTASMEIAAILLLAETKRKQGLLGAPSKVSFLSKLHYPLWAVPWESRSLIVDGLGVSPSVIAKQQSPDVTVFIEDVERGASVRELFRNALEKHLNTFNDFAGRVHVPMDALMADGDLLTELSEYVNEALSEQRGRDTAIVLAPPKLDVQAAVQVARLRENLGKQIRSEIASFEYARNLLGSTAKFHEEMILKETSSARDAFNVKVAKLKPAVDRKVDQLIKERDARLAKMERIRESELKGKESEKARRERELQKLELGQVDLVRKREARRRKHDKVGEAHWEHRIRANENRINEVKARIRALLEFIEKTRVQAEADIERMRRGYQWLIDQEMRKITEIEAQLNETVGVKQREIEALKLVAKKIGDEIERLRVRKEDESEELKRLSISAQFDDVTLLCLPFYLVCCQGEKANRFHIFPPVKVLSAEGVVTTLRKKLRDLRATSRVSLFLQPRSKALNQMLESVVEKKMKSDKTFSEDLIEAANCANILLKEGFKEMLTKGVAELRAEGWVTPKEEALTKKFT